MKTLVIEPDTLAARLGDSMQVPDDLLIVDICRDENYERHHLPGAVHVSPAELVCGERPAVGKLPTRDRLESLFARIGYEPNKHIIAYDDEGGGWAGRFIWTLDVIGHADASYLNGGLVAWAEAQLPLTDAVPEIPTTSVSLTIAGDVIATLDEVSRSLAGNEVQIWDARSQEEYLGMKSGSARAGHIPGAINLDWLELMDRERGLRLREDLESVVSSRGFDKSKSIITHCQTHHRSGLTYLVGKILGFDIKAYDGSWSEWGNDPDTPIEV